MEIRKYQQSDCRELTELFYNTVHTVNAKDYTKTQLDAWATGQVDLDKWNQSLQEHFSIVAVENEVIVGLTESESWYSPHPIFLALSFLHLRGTCFSYES